MTGTAIIMMIIAMLTIWGGLAIAIVNLNARGDVAEDAAVEVTEHREA